MRSDTTLVILAGGRSRRMGRDKAFLPYKGTTFLEYLIRRANGFFDRIIVSTGSREHTEQIRERLGEQSHVRLIADGYDSIGPMGGLMSVFEQTDVQRFVTIAVDIPEADMSVLLTLLQNVRDPLAALMFSADGNFVEACAAAYDRSAYALMKDSFEQGSYSLRKALGRGHVRVLDQAALKSLCPGISQKTLCHSFRNVNTIEELHQLHHSSRIIPEILAPAGTQEAARAAVNAGCDAVYLGGQLFGARAFAGNFDQEALLKTLDHCHLFGVRVYMTVNTLLKDPEMEQLIPYMEPYYRAGLDGVIVQDVGVIRALRKAYPSLALHGSTQMSIASSYGAEFLRAQGLTRVVPARELSLMEIRQIREQVDIEIEAFVHGAMCYAYSGKCLFSSFFGGRSGNRGRCAQPCRQLYDMGGGIREYSLSMKDMCTLSILPQLIDAGIDSFKIEGRMKNPSYVAAAVNAYRKARDAYLACFSGSEGRTDRERLSEDQRKAYRIMAEELTGQLMDIYNRGGFHTGYYETAGSWREEKGLEMISRERPNHDGVLAGSVESVSGPEVCVRLVRDVKTRDVLEIRPANVELTAPDSASQGTILRLNGRQLRRIRPGMQVYRTRNQTLLQEVDRKILQHERTIPGKALVYARIGQPLRITISSPDHVSVTEKGDTVERAAFHPTSRDDLIAKMQKTGGTHVELEVECELDEQAFVPMSSLNELRRKAVEAYREAICSRYRRT